ncbi:hypothetical protein QBC43DRAFT_207794 [Cladorrhinum sp. PSN259]|nr:hypothetical protein QBC43DRAFT_207794 [Cladorrhinum sp. PSN259]
MASLVTSIIDTEPKICQTASSYSWYHCSSGDTSFAGCCRVDPCANFVDCPLSARGEPVASTSAIATSSLSSSSSSSSLTPPGPYTAPTSASPTAGGGSSHGMSVSVSAIVGIVVGCGIAAIFAVLATLMWYGRRRRERREKRQHAQRLETPRTIDDELVPPGLESVFNPMDSNGPGSVFDRTEGRMSKASRESFIVQNPPVRESYMSGTTQFGLVNHIAAPGIRNDYASGTPSNRSSQLSPNSAANPRYSVGRHPELDPAPIAELPTASGHLEQHTARKRVQHVRE